MENKTFVSYIIFIVVPIFGLLMTALTFYNAGHAAGYDKGQDECIEAIDKMNAAAEKRLKAIRYTPGWYGISNNGPAKSIKKMNNGK